MAGKRGNPNFRKDRAPEMYISSPEQPDKITLHRTDSLAARALVRRSDNYRNQVSGLGTFRDRSQHTYFEVDPLPFDICMNIWRGDDMASRAVELLPKEARRKGYDLVIPDYPDGKDLSEAVRMKLDTLGADQYLQTAGEYERGYGGGAVLLGVNDGTDDLTEPLNLKNIISLDYLTVFEPRELLPLYGYADPRQPKYGQPEIYQLVSRSVLPSHSGKYAAVTMQIHESRLLVFPGLRVSRYQVMSINGGWGDGILVRMWRILRAFNEIYGHVEHLVGDFAQAVYKLKGLYESLAEDDDTTFYKRMQAMDMGRSTIRALVLDAEDSFERKATPMTGIPEVMREFCIRLAGAADTPMFRLFGTMMPGLNATGEGEIAMWDDRVASYQQDKISPPLRRLIEICMFLELQGKNLPEKWDIKFRPLRQPTEKDIAAAHFAQAQADNLEVQAGISSPEEIAVSRHGGAEYSYDTHIDFAAREMQDQVASAPVSPAELPAIRPGAAPSKDYVPPPPQGSAIAKLYVAPPGPAAAPDPNTPPVPIVQSEDSATAVRGIVRQHAPLARFRADYADAWRADRDIAVEVRQQLEEDYPPEAMQWIGSVSWEGPERVPLAALDFAHAQEWRAQGEPDRATRMAAKIESGWEKPIVAVRAPGSSRLTIVDGHHRALAYRDAGKDPMVYVAEVPSTEGAWTEMHDSQRAKPAT